MKTKLLGVIAACTFALTVGTANADTFQVSGEFDQFVGHINPFPFNSQNPIDMTRFPLPTRIDGTLTFDAGILTSLHIFISPAGTLNGLGGVQGSFPGSTSSTFVDDQNWTLALHYGPSSGGLGEFVYQLDLTLTDTAGLLAAMLFKVAQPGVPPYDSYIGNFTDFHGTAVLQTPLPAALPLFATGLGALGLLGWRRKRKQAATV